MLRGAAASLRERALEVLSWHQGRQRWRLSARSVLILGVYVLTNFCLTAGILIFQLRQPGNEPWVTATASGWLFHDVITASACFGYIRVGSKVVRSTQLHLHGLVMLIFVTSMPWYTLSEVLLFEESCVPGGVLVAASVALWAVQKAALFMLMLQKMMALGHLTIWRWPSDHWVKTLAVSAVLVSVGGGGLYLWWYSVLVHRNFVTCDEALQSSSANLATSDLPLLDKIVMMLFLLVSSLGANGVFVAGYATMLVVTRLRSGAVAKLIERQVEGEELARVQRTLRQHWLGMVASITSTQLVMVAALVDGINLFGDGRESLENFVVMVAGLLDVMGDVSGVMLLSGIGVLLVHEDPEAGDVSGHIRSLLHAAVLTSRAQMVFEGRVEASSRSRLCVASFPGKFLGDWNSLTWACEQGNMCSACVFLPTSDPLQRFGKHADNPDMPGRCWCHALYGEEKPWGCLWFQAWKTNVERATELDLELVAVFFPGQAGKGTVAWESLGNADLWDGVGLGGSQKSEVAYLRMRGFPVTELDLASFRQRINGTAPQQLSDVKKSSPPQTIGTPVS